MAFEQVLEGIGGFGFFNKTIMMAALVLGTWHTSLIFLSHFFVLIPPTDMWCFVNGTSSSWTAEGLPKGECLIMHETADGNYMNVSSPLRKDKTTCPTDWAYDTTEFFVTATMEV